MSSLEFVSFCMHQIMNIIMCVFLDSCPSRHRARSGADHLAGGGVQQLNVGADLSANHRDHHVLAEWHGQTQLAAVEGSGHHGFWHNGFCVRHVCERVADGKPGDGGVGASVKHVSA